MGFTKVGLPSKLVLTTTPDPQGSPDGTYLYRTGPVLAMAHASTDRGTQAVTPPGGVGPSGGRIVAPVELLPTPAQLVHALVRGRHRTVQPRLLPTGLQVAPAVSQDGHAGAFHPVHGTVEARRRTTASAPGTGRRTAGHPSHTRRIPSSVPTHGTRRVRGGSGRFGRQHTGLRPSRLGTLPRC